MKTNYTFYKTYPVNLGNGVCGYSTWKRSTKQCQLTHVVIRPEIYELFGTRPNLDSILFIRRLHEN